jgi:cytochrome c-type biogenesis protein
MIAEAYIYLGVALAGLVSFLSPCVLPLVPPYLGYLGGTTISQVTAKEGIEGSARRRIVLGSMLFVLGFTTVFVGLGASASVAGQVIQTYRIELSIAAGLVIIAFGLHFLGVLRIPLLYREARYHAETQGIGYIGAYLIGLAFAFGWTPCIGPVLSAVLMVAANEASVAAGARLLFVYSLGLGIPFILAAVAIGPFLGFMQRFKRHLGRVEKAMGIVLIVTGIAFLNVVPWLSIGALGQWLIETFPGLVTIEESFTPKSLQTEIMNKGLGK